MPNIFDQPELQIATSSSSMSSSPADNPLHNRQSKRGRSRQQPSAESTSEADPILCSRSEVGTTNADSKTGNWTDEEQERFISLIMPYIQGKSLSQEEIQLIRSEAQQAHLPVECVDRLIAQNEQHNQQLSLQKHQREDFETIEDVDESDNILSYFSRMATLKQGGHFPNLNTEAIRSFVEQEEDCNNISEEVEVDLDVGFVNKSLNISMEETAILHGDESSWMDSSDDDNLSQVSTAIADHRNRYATFGTNHQSSSSRAKRDAFEALLVGARESQEQQQQHPSDSSDLDSIEQERRRHESASTFPSSLEETSTTQTETTSDWAPPSTRPTRTYRYGYERDLAEWRRKTEIALWQPPSNSRSSATSFLSCHALAEAAVAEELNGLLWGVDPRPPRLRGITAVRNLVQQTEERQRRRQERNEVRHVPESAAAAPKSWQLPYRERCKASHGYIGVDQYSLMDTAAPLHPLDVRDSMPWETRDVRQHFLHEQSITMSRNWFGRLRKKNGNDPIKYRPCRPNTMGMPSAPSEASETDYDDCEWTDAPSKTTASKSWKTKDSRSSQGDVNKTASLSFTSGDEATNQSHSDEDDWTRNTHSRDGNSTYNGTQSGSHMEVDFGSMMSSMLTSGNDTLTSTTYSNLRNRDGYGVPGMSEDEDEVASAGVSAILDADYDDDQWSKNTAGRPGTVTSVTTDRYVSSFSESSSSNDPSSTRSDDSSETSNPTSSASSSSGYHSYRTGDSESTSSYCTEDAQECGTLVNVKPKLGERVSRVTPDHTSHLLRSRFRKKYLRTFPFDKYMN